MVCCVWTDVPVLDCGVWCGEAEDSEEMFINAEILANASAESEGRFDALASVDDSEERCDLDHSTR